jgi:transposase-like protein
MKQLSNTKRENIQNALTRGTSVKTIIKRFGVSAPTVYKLKSSLPQVAETNHQTNDRNVSNPSEVLGFVTKASVALETLLINEMSESTQNEIYKSLLERLMRVVLLNSKAGE